MEDKKELVRQWIQKAEHDLSAAQSLIVTNPNLTDVICFHCQQVSEKYIKAYWLN